MKKYCYIACLLMASFAVGCEDLEETYDEYAGDGKIQYVGKCSDVEVSPGWERLRLVWKNNLDASIRQVKITWQSELEAEPFVKMIDRQTPGEKAGEMDTIFLEGLRNALYSVKISNLSADKESMVVQAYARPYTVEHEDLRTFTRGIVNFYPLGERLVVMLDEDNENLKEVVLTWQDVNGVEQTWNVKEHMNDSIDLWWVL